MYRRRVLSASMAEDESGKALSHVASPHAVPQPQLRQRVPSGSLQIPLRAAPAEISSKSRSASPGSPMDGHMSPKTDSSRTERKQQRRMIHKLHRCMAQSGAVAFAFSASALQRRMDSLAKMDEVSKFKKARHGTGSGEQSPDAAGGSGPVAAVFRASRLVKSTLRVYLLRSIALLSLGLRNIGEAIGESPLRRTQRLAAEAGLGADQHEAPLELFWAFNLLMISITTCAALVICAFSAQTAPEELDVVEEAISVGIDASLGELQEYSATKLLRLGLRIMVVAVVSFTSGMGLRVIHPLQSAILTGL
eukprot:gb/GFBE01063303.1/.p1 GENE.gb/GFBE01063303.1/~~gb/GFBE01063303.1/.p1  ORF type:complete len:307 (+),score=50.89 gb/GFBE01063303.1/:1-921(+)